MISQAWLELVEGNYWSLDDGDNDDDDDIDNDESLKSRELM